MLTITPNHQGPNPHFNALGKIPFLINIPTTEQFDRLRDFFLLHNIAIIFHSKIFQKFTSRKIVNLQKFPLQKKHFKFQRLQFYHGHQGPRWEVARHLTHFSRIGRPLSEVSQKCEHCPIPPHHEGPWYPYLIACQYSNFPAAAKGQHILHGP